MEVETMRYYYANKLWTHERLDNLLSAGKITKPQYDYITASLPDENLNKGKLNGMEEFNGD